MGKNSEKITYKRNVKFTKNGKEKCYKMKELIFRKENRKFFQIQKQEPFLKEKR